MSTNTQVIAGAFLVICSVILPVVRVSLAVLSRPYRKESQFVVKTDGSLEPDWLFDVLLTFFQLPWALRLTLGCACLGE
jgi:hypothetical protein